MVGLVAGYVLVSGCVVVNNMGNGLLGVRGLAAPSKLAVQSNFVEVWKVVRGP